MLSHVQLIRKAVWSSFVITGEQCDESLISKNYVPIDFGPEETKTTAELGNYFITNFMLLAQLQGKAFESTIERTLLRDKLIQNCTRRIVLLRFQAGGHYSLPFFFPNVRFLLENVNPRAQSDANMHHLRFFIVHFCDIITVKSFDSKLVIR